MKSSTKKSTETTNAQETPKHTFEDAVSDLEKIINVLEREDLTLDNALANFEHGIRLIRICDDHLKTARGKILELIRGDDGEIVEKTLGQTLESFLNGEQYND